MKTRGMGSVYQRNEIWWVRYYFQGKLYRESSKSPKQRKAIKLLQRRQGEIAQGQFAGPEAEKVTFEDLVELMRADYKQKQNRTWDRVEHALKHLNPVFGNLRASAINYSRVSRYISARLDAGAARGTIHHELAALGRMLKLGVLAGRLHVRPPLPVLKVDNVRKGFFTDDEVRPVLKHLPDWYAPAIEFGWRTGWRSGEVKGLTWSQVDFRAGTVRLEPGTTKNREGRVFPFAAFPALAELLQRQWERTQEWQRMHGQIVPWVFWRDGRRLGDHRDKWTRACRLAGLPGRLVHDLRRSAVRNLERAGVPRSSAMKLTGHLTESVYHRYAIVSEADLAEAVGKLAAFQQRNGAVAGGPDQPFARTSTIRAQIDSSDPDSESADDSGTESRATGTHDASGTSATAFSPAAIPATVPLDHAHWKLNPPSSSPRRAPRRTGRAPAPRVTRACRRTWDHRIRISLLAWLRPPLIRPQK